MIILFMIKILIREKEFLCFISQKFFCSRKSSLHKIYVNTMFIVTIMKVTIFCSFLTSFSCWNEENLKMPHLQCNYILHFFTFQILTHLYHIVNDTAIMKEYVNTLCSNFELSLSKDIVLNCSPNKYLVFHGNFNLFCKFQGGGSSCFTSSVLLSTGRL